MNFLLFTFTRSNLTVQEKQMDLLISEHTLPLTSMNFPQSFESLALQIKEKYPTIIGAVCNGLSAEFYAAHPQLSPLNAGAEAIIKLLSETLNIPVLTAEESAAADDLEQAFKEKRTAMLEFRLFWLYSR